MSLFIFIIAFQLFMGCIFMENNFYECDVLVVGSGGAGCRAAIEVAKNNLEVIIVSKGLSFKSGCTGMAEGGYNASFAYVDEEDSADAHFKDTIKGGQFINDEKLVSILVDEAPERLIDLEDYGALFDRQESGLLNQRAFGGQSYRRTCFQGDRTGHEMITALKEEVIKNKIKTIDEVMISSLIVHDGKVQGAIGLSIKNSEIIVFKAKSTILATGGAGQMFPITSNTIQKDGDGFLLAYNANADLIDMEQIQFHPTGMLYPDSRRGVLVTEAVRGEGGILRNKDNERFMSNYDSRMELATRDVVARAIYNEIREGRGTDNGGVYLDVSHLDNDLIEEKLETMLLQFLDVGVDIRNVPMEVAPTAHHFMGGIKIDENGKTNIKNLFAAGEVTGGVHGANRLGGNALADTQVFGLRAGISASKNIIDATDEEKEFFKGEINLEEVLKEKERIFSYINKGNILPITLKKEIQNIMWTNVAIIRNGDGLKEAFKEIIAIEQQLDDLNVSEEKTYNMDLVNAIELRNMIQLAKLIIKSAFIRRESRGSHYREDYPETSKDWKKTILINKKRKLRFISR